MRAAAKKRPASGEQRYYMPALARWTTTDPAGQYASPYVYAGNDPVNVVDPTGLYGAGCRGTCGPVQGFDEDGRDTPQEVWNRMHAKDPMDWYRNAAGQAVYDEDIQSQADLDRQLIDGDYIGESFLAMSASGEQRFYAPNGMVTNSVWLEGTTITAKGGAAGKVALGMSGISAAVAKQRATLNLAARYAPDLGKAAQTLRGVTGAAGIGLTAASAFTSIGSEFTEPDPIGTYERAKFAADAGLAGLSLLGGWPGAGAAFALEVSGVKSAAVNAYVNWRTQVQQQRALRRMMTLDRVK